MELVTFDLKNNMMLNSIMGWLKENWFKIIIGLALVLGLTTYINDSDLEIGFQLDIANLPYELPTHNLICVPESLQHCSGGSNCEQLEPKVFLLIDTTNQRYSRCDSQPCDTYEADFSESGIYTIIQPLPPAHGQVKITSGGIYTETNTLGNNVYINSGRCFEGLSGL